jgi:hypothetical protein
MPLAFESLSHGTIAFGFFNIDSDMLLLDKYFFFADEFCGIVRNAAKGEACERFERPWKFYIIEKDEDAGDLMGAIHGVRFTGFIGETYRRYPFPGRAEDFKQKPDGHKTRGVISGMIRNYARAEESSFIADPGKKEISIGAYRFEVSVFQELVNYVWVGGYPRWLGGIRPDYVLEMKKEIDISRNWIFEGMKKLEI